MNRYNFIDVDRGTVRDPVGRQAIHALGYDSFVVRVLYRGSSEFCAWYGFIICFLLTAKLAADL